MAVKASATITLIRVDDGATGTGVDSITTEYYLSTSKITQTGGSWSSTPPSWSSGKYLWIRDKVVYKNPANTVYTTPYCDSSWEAVNEVEIGGRNLIPSAMMSSISEGYSTKEFIASAWAGEFIKTEDLLTIIEPSTEYTIKYDVELIERTEIPTSYAMTVGLLLYSPTISSANRSLYASGLNSTDAVVGDKGSALHTFITPDELPDDYKILIYTRKWTTNGSDPAGYDTIKFTNLKLEKGNKATDYTLAPEDDDAKLNETVDDINKDIDLTNNRIAEAESLIAKLDEMIATLVSDENGTSLMTQTSEGWTFNISSIQNELNKASNDLDELTKELGNTDSTVDVLNQAINDLGTKTKYIDIGTFEGEPCILLGKTGSDSSDSSNFRLRITNTRIIFTEGNTVQTYIDTTGLVTSNIKIDNDLVQGGFVWKIHGAGNLGLVWKGVDE